MQALFAVLSEAFGRIETIFRRELANGQRICPFDIAIVMGSYWLTWLESKPMTPAMEIFRDWLVKAK